MKLVCLLFLSTALLAQSNSPGSGSGTLPVALGRRQIEPRPRRNYEYLSSAVDRHSDQYHQHLPFAIPSTRRCYIIHWGQRKQAGVEEVDTRDGSAFGWCI
jgi:hypothetical protein